MTRKIDPSDYRLVASWKSSGASWSEIAEDMAVTIEAVKIAVKIGARQRSFND